MGIASANRKSHCDFGALRAMQTSNAISLSRKSKELQRRFDSVGHCPFLGKSKPGLANGVICSAAHGGVTNLSFLSLIFWQKARKTTKKTRIFYPRRTPKIPGKERKNAQKKGIPRTGKKTRNSKKTRKGRTGKSGVDKRVVSKRCSPGTKTGTRVRSHVPPEREPERGYVRQNHPFMKPPFFLPV